MGGGERAREADTELFASSEARRLAIVVAEFQLLVEARSSIASFFAVPNEICAATRASRCTAAAMLCSTACSEVALGNLNARIAACATIGHPEC